ncbi:MAG: CDP-alcohol phosphatidyltransferase family protein [Rhodobacterales bacterium]|nr:CDP-alcohol phosphatidyltransferase family protein [Rhodobacterales bacterium]MDX5392170.1 CDP-alcohol phosphatidyltransferase family protein [Rhodobacterales bacterium]MDX5491861.1 CDP-alcohol phosphatidyltransferase family protein [Rhodobacterales bacterium]
MIDALILPTQRRVLHPLASALYRRGVAADRITLAGFALGLLAVPALALGWYGAALVLILLNRLADGLDGAVGGQGAPPARGAVRAIARGLVVEPGVPRGVALGPPPPQKSWRQPN